MVLRALIVVVLATAGCGPDRDGPSSRGPIEFARFGGIGGSSERLTISADGEARFAVGRRDAKPVRFEVPDDELRRLRAVLTAADLGSLKSDTEPTCCDMYTVVVGYGGEKATGESEFPEGLEPPVRALEAIVKRHACPGIDTRAAEPAACARP